MTDYIDREAVLEAIDSCRVFYKWNDSGEAYNTINRDALKKKIEAIPAADVRPVVGAIWQYKTMTVPGGKGQTYAKWCCTACKGKAKERTNYCPNCGAEMSQEDRE